MIRHWIRYTLIVTVVLISTNAISASKNGQYSVSGLGASSCSQFLNVSKSNDVRAIIEYANWLEGYITAYNYLSKDTFEALPIADRIGLLTFIRNGCANAPKTRISDMVLDLLESFEPYRLRTHSELIVAEHNGKRITVRRETLARAQMELQKKGLYTSTIDGLYGKGTRSALLSYQKSNNLAQTGLPDGGTLIPLLFTEIVKKRK